MAGFLTNLGLAAGQNILTGQVVQERQADIDLKKQQVAMGQMALQQAQQQQKTQQEVGQFLQSQAQLDASNITDPVKAAQNYEKASGIAMRDGDFVSANTLGELAKGKLSEAKEQAATLTQQQQVKKEALATSADDYATNPTPENAKALMQKAVDAGVSPTSIPNPGTPQWESWVNNQKLASKTAAQRADFVQKAYEMDSNRQEKQQEHADSVALRQASMQQSAMLREQMIGLRREEFAAREEDRKARETTEKKPQIIDVNGKQYEYDPTGQLPGARDLPDQRLVQIGEKLTAQQKTGISRGSYSAAEVGRSLGKVLSFDPGTTTSPFAHLGATTPAQALARVGSNALTPAQMQAMQVNAAGLGNQIASLESALGGRMAAGTQQQHLQDMATPQAGDSGYTAMYKIANAKELTITALKHLPGGFANTQEGKDQIAELEKEVPFSTSDVIGLMKKDPTSQKDDATIRRLVDDTAKVKDNIANAAPGVGLPGQADAGAGTNAPPLPTGWSVKEH